MTTWTRATLLALVVLGSACDPGLDYAIDGGQGVMEDGLRYVVTSPRGTRVLIYASMFAGGLSVELKVSGTGPRTTELSSLSHMTVENAHTSPLPEEWARVWCEHQPESVEYTIAVGET